jgi:hypothetical protein
VRETQQRLRCLEVVARGGGDLPTFRFSRLGIIV